MIAAIILYELKRRLTHWSSPVIFLVMIFQGVWYTKATFDYYVNEDMLMNASGIFYKNLSAGGVLMVIIVAMITGTVLMKELDHKTGQWTFTLPVKEKHFFLSKFFSAYFINVILGIGYPLGMLLTPYVGIADAGRFGPAPFGPLFHGYLVGLMPTLFIVNCAVFAAIVQFRSMGSSYLAVIVLTILFQAGDAVSLSDGYTPAAQLLDPLSYVATGASVNEMSVVQKNSGYQQVINSISLPGYLQKVFGTDIFELIES